MIAAVTIPPGANAGQCSRCRLLALMGDVEVCSSGRLLAHPSAPMLRELCPGVGQLARHLGKLPGFLMKENEPGTRYVIWSPVKRYPVGILQSREDALAFGFNDQQLTMTHKTGHSVTQGPGWWGNDTIEVGDWGLLPREQLVPFAQLLLGKDIDGARAMLMRPRRGQRQMEVASDGA